jgi:phosphatidylserine/phosphatidylglycerophosphate/cardiolipin synthase-like enzyme
MSLSDVSTADLAKVRDLVACGALRCPLGEASLRSNGFGSLGSQLSSALAFESSQALVKALDLVIEERTRSERPPLELVWTGPDTTSPQTRDTAVVLGDLFRRAERRVLVAGYVFTQGKTILQPLHEALVRGIEARLFLDLPGVAPSENEIPAYAATCVGDFIRWNWPFGEPYPAFFYDPRTARPGPDVLLHAKCAVADGRHALVTSANFTGPGQTRHIEVGVLIDDVRFAGRLEGQFNGLVAQGALTQVPPTSIQARR